ATSPSMGSSGRSSTTSSERGGVRVVALAAVVAVAAAGWLGYRLGRRARPGAGDRPPADELVVIEARLRALERRPAALVLRPPAPLPAPAETHPPPRRAPPADAAETRQYFAAVEARLAAE